MFKLHEKS